MQIGISILLSFAVFKLRYVHELSKNRAEKRLKS